MPLSRLVVKSLSRLALACLLVVADRIMVHRPMSLDRAHGRARRIQPFARGPDRIAARRALAFEHPRRLLPRPRGLAIRVEPGMGEGAGPGEDRGYHGKEGIAGDKGAAGICRCGAGAAQRATAWLIAVAGRGGPRSPFPLIEHTSPAAPAASGRACPPRASDRHPHGPRRQRRLGRSVSGDRARPAWARPRCDGPGPSQEYSLSGLVA